MVEVRIELEATLKELEGLRKKLAAAEAERDALSKELQEQLELLELNGITMASLMQHQQSIHAGAASR